MARPCLRNQVSPGRNHGGIRHDHHPLPPPGALSNNPQGEINQALERFLDIGESDQSNVVRPVDAARGHPRGGQALRDPANIPGVDAKGIDVHKAHG